MALAAEELHVTLAAISQLIKQLAGMLGKPLFVHGKTWTPARTFVNNPWGSSATAFVGVARMTVSAVWTASARAKGIAPIPAANAVRCLFQ